MNKTLPLLFLLLSGILSHMAAQTVCINNVDTNGNVCTNFTTSPTRSMTRFLIDYEDGQADPPNFVGAFIVNFPSVQVDIPFDPLILEGFVPGHGSTASDLSGTVQSARILAKGGCIGTWPCARAWYTERWAVADVQNIYNSDYPYTWSGTFTVTFTCQHAGRYGRGCGYYKAGEGNGKLSAVHN